MTDSPRITVHVPCHNYGTFLPDALDSLLRQSFHDWEAVVIDDASNDETETVLDRYDDPRIRVVRHTVRHGHIATFNEGIELAAGDLFVILSADDRYKPAFFERVATFFEAHPDVTFVTTNGDHIDEHGRTLRAESAPFECSGVYDALPVLFDWTFVAASAGVARTATLRSLGGYDPRLPHSADTYLWRRLAIAGPVGWVHERLYERRFHDRSMTRTVRRSLVLETELADQLERIFRAHDLPPRVRAMHDRAYSELHWKIAQAYFADRRFGRTVTHAAAAIRFDRDVVTRHHPVRALLRAAKDAVASGGGD